jgi:hypothetical protein
MALVNPGLKVAESDFTTKGSYTRITTYNYLNDLSFDTYLKP